MELHEVTDPDNRLAQEAFALYERSFSFEERLTLDEIAEAMRSGANSNSPSDRISHFWVWTDLEVVVGVGIFQYMPALRLGYMDYLVVRPERRGHGYGSTFFQAILAQLARDASELKTAAPLGLCFEVERPETALTPVDRELRERRIHFYERNGAFLIGQVDFVAPPLRAGLPPLPYHLMFRWVRPNQSDLTQQEIYWVVETILQYGYGLDPDDHHLKQTLAALRLGDTRL